MMGINQLRVGKLSELNRKWTFSCDAQILPYSTYIWGCVIIVSDQKSEHCIDKFVPCIQEINSFF